MLRISPLGRTVHPSPKHLFTTGDVKEWELVRSMGSIQSFYDDMDTLRNLYNFHLPFSCDQSDNYWINQLLTEVCIRARRCLKYIGKLRFKSTKIPFVNRHNFRKAERVYPSQKEHLAMAKEVIGD